MSQSDLVNQEHAIMRPDRSVPPPIGVDGPIEVDDTGDDETPIADADAGVDEGERSDAEWLAQHVEVDGPAMDAPSLDPGAVDAALATEVEVALNLDSTPPTTTNIDGDVPPQPPRVRRPRAKTAAKAMAAPAANPIQAAFARAQSRVLAESPIGLIDVAEPTTIQETEPESEDDTPLSHFKGKGKAAGEINGKGKRKSAGTGDGKGNKRHKGSGSDETTGTGSAKGNGKRKSEGKGCEKGGKRRKASAPTAAAAERVADPPVVERDGPGTVDDNAEPGEQPGDENRQIVPTGPQLRCPPCADFVRSAENEPALGSAPIFCNWCKSECTIANVRVTGKKSGIYKCKWCHSTLSKVRKVGSWPTSNFLALSEEEQAQFYKDAADESSTAVIMKMAENRIEKYKTQEQAWMMGGAFLPLKVWETQGHDPVRIQNNTLPEDICETAQMGVCYRLRILTTLDRGATGSARHVGYTATNGDRPLSITDAAAPATQVPAAPAIESAADLLARQKRERTERLAQDKAIAAKRSTASTLSKKLAIPLDNLQKALDDIALQTIAPQLKKAAVDALTAALAEQALLNKCVDDPASSNYEPNNQKEAMYAWIGPFPLRVRVQAAC